jgi:hypothetical protein
MKEDLGKKLVKEIDARLKAESKATDTRARKEESNAKHNKPQP